MIEHKQIFIDGKWVDSSGSDVLTVINPVTEEPIATVPRGSAEDVDHAAQAAAKAFPSWSRSTLEQRVEIFTKLARVTEARSQEITRTIVTELGYPITFATKSGNFASTNGLSLGGGLHWVLVFGSTRLELVVAN